MQKAHGQAEKLVEERTSELQRINLELQNAKEIAEKILYLEQDQIFYQNQIKYGLNRVQKFSWAQTAENLLSLYKTI